MESGKKAVDLCGFVQAHGDAFAHIAKTQDVVIMSRAVNVLSTGLLQQGYAAKGFHIKAKSCNFGPMAGFVCLEPLFSKNGSKGVDSQFKNNKKSLQAGCKEKQIQITKERLQELVNLKKIKIVPTEKDQPLYKIEAIGDLPDGVKDVKYIARLNKSGQLELFIDIKATANPKKWYTLNGSKLEGPAVIDKEEYPVYGLTNPPGCEKDFGVQPKNYLAAVAADYDLFCLCPRRGTSNDTPEQTKRPMRTEALLTESQLEMLNPPSDKYKSEEERKKRIVDPSVLDPLLDVLSDISAHNRKKLLEALLKQNDIKKEVQDIKPAELSKDENKTKFTERLRKLTSALIPSNKIKIFHNEAKSCLANLQEMEHTGNITSIGQTIKTLLNKEVTSRGYSGGNVVMHSDEAGNPFSEKPDYPLLAFVPNEDVYAIEDAKELQEFYKALTIGGSSKKYNLGVPMKNSKILGFRLYDVTLNPNWF